MGTVLPGQRKRWAALGLLTVPWTGGAGRILLLVNWVGALREPTFAHEIIYSCA